MVQPLFALEVSCRVRKFKNCSAVYIDSSFTYSVYFNIQVNW